MIAIVGRPNVGKSALFNRIVGKRIAIVHDQPGVTRDRITAEAEWRGKPFTLADTGGIGLLHGEKTQDAIVRAAFEQVRLAVEAADVILLTVDAREGLTPLDREVAGRLRQSGKKILLVVNKVDSAAAEASVDEFSELGFTEVFCVSAIHGLGIGPLLTAAAACLPAEMGEPMDDSTPATRKDGPLAGPLKIAIVGRPNVGKSSLVNALTQSERVVVSPVPGTTRDAVDVPFEVETDGVRQKYVLIDTAGLRKARRVADSIEFFSVKRAEGSIARCDLVVLVLDAEAGVTEQDKKIGDWIVEHRKACVVVVNKWDLMADAVGKAQHEEKRRRRTESGKRPSAGRHLTTLAEFGGWVQSKLFFLDYAPVIFTSAVSGFHLERLLEAIRYVTAQLQQKIPTAILNRALHEAIEGRQPISATGQRLKFFYATQVRQAPPTFLLFVNRHGLFSPAYAKYLAGELRRAFGYEGCPIVLVPKARPKKPVLGETDRR